MSGISDYYIDQIKEQEKTEEQEDCRKINKKVLAYNISILATTFAITGIGLIIVVIVTRGTEHILSNFIKDSGLVNIVFSLVLSSLLEVLFSTTRKNPVDNRSIAFRKEIGIFSLLASALFGFLLYSVYAIVRELNPNNEIFSAAIIINILYYLLSLFSIGFTQYAHSLFISKRPIKKKKRVLFRRKNV